jgi:acyl-CoA synthetase (NDP forming)
VLAVDHLIDLGGSLTELSADTLSRLGAFLPSGWSRANPVDIIGDADADRYGKSLEVLLSDRMSDAVLVLNVATAPAMSWRDMGSSREPLLAMRSASKRNPAIRSPAVLTKSSPCMRKRLSSALVAESNFHAIS